VSGGLRRSVAVLSIWVVGCGGAPPPATPSKAVPAGSVTPHESKAVPAGQGAENTEGLVAETLREAANIRELAATASVRGVALSRAQMASQVRSTIEREVPAAVVIDEGEVLVALGVAPPSFDYLGATITLMSSELAGYYDPATKTMYLASDLPPTERSATLSHELIHALQDQHYDLGKLLDYRPDESDMQGALHALAEGDATSAMLDQMLASKDVKATDLSDELIGVQVRAAAQFTAKAGDVPEILRRSMIAPYIDGILFVHYLRRRGGWAEVDRIWKAPPASTEQLLHPEKLLAHEAPETLPVPMAPDATWRAPNYTDVMGEQSVRLLVEEWLPRVPAAEAASDWSGDRVAVFRAGPRTAVGWHLRYDTRAAATRVAAALMRGVEKQAAPGARVPTTRCTERPAVGPLLVAQRDRDIAVIAGPYEHTGDTARSAGTCAAAAAWAARILAQR
jgi:hypothetical protein